MNEIDEIKKNINAVINNYKSAALAIVSDYRTEEQIRQDYRGRQIYEILQNADDCYSDEIKEINVKFEIKDDLFIIQNNGIPFSARGLASLMYPGASSKYKGTIGCKGLGFRSILNWTDNIRIVTRNFVASFSKESAKNIFNKIKNEQSEYREELDRIDRVAILSSLSIDEFNDEFLEKDYSTAIVLKCEKDVIEQIRNQLANLKFVELLFLKHIVNIDIVGEGINRNIQSIKSDGQCVIQEDQKEASAWRLWNKEGKISLLNGDEKMYSICLAYNVNRDARKLIQENANLYNYFETEIPMPFPFLIHGTFELNSERNHLIKESEANAKILDLLIDMIIEKGKDLANEQDTNPYDILDFMLPCKEIAYLDRQYNFSYNLKERLINSEIFPTIEGKFISLKNNPHYINYNFVNNLNTNTFNDLLMYTDNEKILNLYKEYKICKYNIDEFIKRINKDADEYVKNNVNEILIAYFCDEYPYANAAPYLIKDRDGNRVLDTEIKIFATPELKDETEIDIPIWSKMRFIDEQLESSLRKKYNCNSRVLMDKLKNFGCSEYSFDRVLRELINQSRNDIERTKDLIVWLFNYWNKKDRSLPSNMVGIDLKLIDRKGKICSTSSSYFGREYGNEVGERILMHTSEIFFVASIEYYGIQEQSKNLFISFLKYIGIKKYPKIVSQSLNDFEIAKYLEYNKNNYSNIFTNSGEQYSLNEFFYQNDKKIVVDYIRNFDRILIESTFEDILYWFIDDDVIKLKLSRKNEDNEKSLMKGKPKYAQDFREISKDYMVSWIKFMLRTLNWLPSKNNIQVNCRNCVIKDNPLSPVVNTLKIDYTKVNKPKREIDTVLEQIGIADDIEFLDYEKIYEVLLNLPKLDKNRTFGKKLYTRLNARFDKDEVNKLITSNKNYNEFKKTGMVLSQYKDNYEYMPVNQVYYVGKKNYSEEVLYNYPKITLNRRIGDKKVEDLFCVSSISKIGEVKISNPIEHPLNNSYNQEYRKYLPYLYAVRINNDYNDKDLRKFKNSKVFLVSQANIKYQVNGVTNIGKLKDFELIYSDNIAYIKVPSRITTINELKSENKFLYSMAEMIMTMLDIESNKETFTFILHFKDISEVEEYFKTEYDPMLVLLNMAKSKFSSSISFKDEYWKALSEASNKSIDELLSAFENDYNLFDYENINSENNFDLIKNTFELLDVDIDKFNLKAFNNIDLNNHFKREFNVLKNKYREKYLKYSLENCITHDCYEDEFIKIKEDYDYYDSLTTSNSIKFNVEKKFEEIFNVKLTELDGIDDTNIDFNNLGLKKKDPSISQNNDGIIEQSVKKVIDYDEIVTDMQSQNNIDIETYSLSAPQKQLSTSHEINKSLKGKHNYDKLQATKDEDGFKAELKVYLTLRNLLPADQSISWVSSNASKSKLVNNDDTDDSLGYDMKYSDSNGVHYVEVKGTSGKNLEFHLSKNEYDFASKNKEKYEIWFVFIKDGIASNPINLGNLFDLNEGESFFSNSKFLVEQSEFVISIDIKNN